jgi:hypothetical protein
VVRAASRGSAGSDHRMGSTTALAIAHRCDRGLLPMKVRPDVGASLATRNRISRSDSRTSSGHRSALIAIEWLQ